MKWLLILLACLMVVRNLRLLHKGKPSRWPFLIFWIGFSVLVMARSKTSGVALCGLLLLVVRWKSLGPLLILFVFIVWRLVRETCEDLLFRGAAWLAYVLGRRVLVIYEDHGELASLLEMQMLPRVGAQAIVVKNSSVARRHRFHCLDCLAFQLVADHTPAFTMVRLRSSSAFWRYDLRKALWMSRNGLPYELEQILDDVLHSPV